MSHRKFERPRHGSLGFLPRKRYHSNKGSISTFPKDDPTQACHFTAFMCYKAGATHVVRDLDRPGSKIHKKEIVEAVTVMEAPPMVVVGITGFVRTVRGLRCLTTVWAQHLPDQFKRSAYKNWYKSRKRCYSKYSANLKVSKKVYHRNMAKLRKHADVIRAICCTQVKLCRFGQRKSHVLEVQVNGGSVPQKVDYVEKLFEQQVPVGNVFNESEMVDTIGVTKGHGFKGVISRIGVTRLPRKTHKGLRKVGCIGAWHPARVSWTVARAGQKGFFHRTEKNKKIYRLSKGVASNPGNATCETDLTPKNITPMGGFVRYGEVTEDYLLIRGVTPGCIKRPITLRKQLRINTSRAAIEVVKVKFIDTSSKFGHGRFQTPEEKLKHMGPLKKHGVRAAAATKKSKTK